MHGYGDAIYAEALRAFATEYEPEDWAALSDAERDRFRDAIYAGLIEDYPAAEADEIREDLAAAAEDFSAGRY